MLGSRAMLGPSQSGDEDRTPGDREFVPDSEAEPLGELSELEHPSTTEVSSMRNINSLRSSPFFAPLDQQTLEALARVAKPVKFEASQRIKTPDHIVLVLQSGEADFYLFDAADKEFLLSQQGPGTLLGELSYLVENRSEDEKIKIIARTEVEALQIPSDKFFEAVLNNRGSAEELMKLLAQRLTAMNRFTKQAVDVNFNPAEIKPTNWKERASDAVREKMGSFRFLGAMGAVTVGWIGANVILANTIAWDPAPFILLNLVYSIMSAATASLVMISQNRQSQIEQKHAHANHQMTLAIDKEIKRLRAEVSGMRRQLGLNEESTED